MSKESTLEEFQSLALQGNLYYLDVEKPVT